MITLKQHRLHLAYVFLGVMAMIIFFSSVTTSHAYEEYNIPCHTTGYADGLIPKYDSFGSPSNLYDTSGELLMRIMCNNRQNAKVILGNDDPNLLIYRYGMEKVNGKFKTLTLNGEREQGDWLFGNAEAALTSTGEGSVLAYMCKQVNNVWKCGCRDRACTQVYWQRQDFVAVSKDTASYYDTQQRDSVLRSTNSGSSFEANFRILTDDTLGPVEVQSISFHPKNKHTLVVNSRNDGLFYRTEDIDMWRKIPFPPQTVYSFLLDTKDPTTRAFAAGVINNNGRIFRTNNWGETWDTVYAEPGLKTQVTAITQDPRNQSVIIAGTSGGTLVRSTDRGDTWENIGQTIKAKINQFAHDATKKSFMYMLMQDGKVMHSTDAGKTWLDWEVEKAKEIKSLRDKASVLSREKDTAGAEKLKKQADALTEKNKTQKRPSGIIYITPDPSRSGVLYAGLAKGLYRSADYGEFWEKINVIESAEQFPIRSIAVHPTKSDEISIVSGNAFYRSTNKGLTWSVTPLDKSLNASFVAYDPFNPTTIYVGLSK